MGLDEVEPSVIGTSGEWGCCMYAPKRAEGNFLGEEISVVIVGISWIQEPWNAEETSVVIGGVCGIQKP